jgi:hypothetical protein
LILPDTVDTEGLNRFTFKVAYLKIKNEFSVEGLEIMAPLETTTIGAFPKPNYVPIRDRLVVAPDCGLGLVSPKLAEDKLRVLCQAAAFI